MKQRVRPVS